MAEKCTLNTYEEARKQQVLENKKRLEDLGILKISKSLSDISKSKRKPQCQVKRKPVDISLIEPRRSSRARNSVPSYRDDVDIGFPTPRKRSSKHNSSWASYLARPIEEVKTASFEERAKALRSAEKLQSNLQSEYPFFIKSMVRSHVYSCFWLGLPTRFCLEHLPKSTIDMVLEDEEGTEYDAIFISSRTGLSGGWRAFALDHKLDDGDALVFELVEPTRFKIYIVKASASTSQDNVEEDGDAKETSKRTKKRNGKSSLQPKSAKKSDAKDSCEAKNSASRKKNMKALDNDDVEDHGIKETSMQMKKLAAKNGPKNVKNSNEKSTGQELRRSQRNR